jgi:hypothetical protein
MVNRSQVQRIPGLACRMNSIILGAGMCIGPKSMWDRIGRHSLALLKAGLFAGLHPTNNASPRLAGKIGRGERPRARDLKLAQRNQERNGFLRLALSGSTKCVNYDLGRCKMESRCRRSSPLPNSIRFRFIEATFLVNDCNRKVVY